MNVLPLGDYETWSFYKNLSLVIVPGVICPKSNLMWQKVHFSEGMI